MLDVERFIMSLSVGDSQEPSYGLRRRAKSFDLRLHSLKRTLQIEHDKKLSARLLFMSQQL